MKTHGKTHLGPVYCLVAQIHFFSKGAHWIFFSWHVALKIIGSNKENVRQNKNPLMLEFLSSSYDFWWTGWPEIKKSNELISKMSDVKVLKLIFSFSDGFDRRSEMTRGTTAPTDENDKMIWNEPCQRDVAWRYYIGGLSGDKVALGVFFSSGWDLMDCVGGLSGIKWR